MIGGIFGTIGQKLGIGKEKYFLELDDAAEKGVENLKGAATKATKVAKKNASDLADKAQELAEDAVDKAQEAASASQAKLKTAAKEAQPAVAAKSAPAQLRDPSDIIKSAIAAGGKKTDGSGNVIDEATNFSTDFLMPLSNSNRRRPGPSLSAFKGMAKEVNPRLKS